MPEALEAAEKVQVAPPASRPDVAKPKNKPEEDVPPPWRILLHNDEVNVFENVVRILHRLTPLSLEESLDRTVTAHTRGRAVLLSTHKERAELYLEQLSSAGLTVTMEKDE
jgi:ATP-dependent Clp protease adaptor protein ClpS